MGVELTRPAIITLHTGIGHQVTAKTADAWIVFIAFATLAGGRDANVAARTRAAAGVTDTSGGHTCAIGALETLTTGAIGIAGVQAHITVHEAPANSPIGAVLVAIA